jgi:hypothetical protein
MRLAQTLVVQRDVELALDAPLAVPGGLAVADQHELDGARRRRVDRGPRRQATAPPLRRGLSVYEPATVARASTWPCIAASACAPVNRPSSGSRSTSSAWTANW